MHCVFAASRFADHQRNAGSEIPPQNALSYLGSRAPTDRLAHSNHQEALRSCTEFAAYGAFHY
jgi:hypothetical protein